jgi:hypothetical protein
MGRRAQDKTHTYTHTHTLTHAFTQINIERERGREAYVDNGEEEWTNQI